MLAVTSAARIYLYTQNVDMRRSFDGLYAIVQSEFTRDIRLGDYFMFINRRRDRIKIIWWDRDGLAIFMKSQESEHTHFNSFTRVELRRNFKRIVDETRSTCF